MSKKNFSAAAANAFRKILPLNAATKASDACPLDFARRGEQAQGEQVTRGAQDASQMFGRFATKPRARALDFVDKEAAPQGALLEAGHSRGPQT
ncbi:MAG TPA: hypothetical protein VGR81_02215 [Candidatus Acidoferrales bacterium]|nr:hypothetical protein [Candidatus Acidoferrales bacterium]